MTTTAAISAPAAAPAPAPTATPRYIQIDWTTGRFGVSNRHQLQLNLQPDAKNADSYIEMRHAKPMGEIPFWFSARVFGQGGDNPKLTAAVRDAVLASEILKRPSDDPLADTKQPGQISITLGANPDGLQPVYNGKLGKLPADMASIFKAAQNYVDDAKPSATYNLADLLRGKYKVPPKPGA